MKRFLLTVFFLGIVFSVFAQKYEAEDGELSGAVKETSLSDYSGNGYISFSSYIQGSAEFTVDAKEDGDFALKIHYASKKADANSAVKFTLDKNYICTQKLETSISFTDVYANNVLHLTKGLHQITVIGMNDALYLDYIEIEPMSDSIKKLIAPPENLCVKNASPEAVQLYKYLCNLKGKAILSGQQIYNSGTAEIKAITNLTGKNPAVLGIDLIDFSPSRVAKGANGGRTISTAKKWWDDGGIVTCCWHWNAPANLVDKDEINKRWYDGFRTGASTFDFVKGLNDQNSEEYKLMLRDIDAIAVQLKKLQDAGVPVLWRPLHEASGKWFWWGSKGAENYIRLYKLLFDRLVNYNGLNNLIWVWNAQDPQWYPGDEYVDVISYDSYPGKHKHSTVEGELSKIQSATTQAKLCAISENGALPDISKLESTKSVWSWFCTWNGDFTVQKDNRTYSEEYTSAELFKKWYDSDWLITKDELELHK